MTKKVDINEIGSVGLQRVIHKRRRTLGDPLSVGKRTTKHKAAEGFRTEGERERSALSLRQQKHKGLLGGGSSEKIKNRRIGFSENGATAYTKIYHLVTENSGWIQGAINPAHKGYCTPMTKETCTPARKALAQRFKKAGKREGTEKGGKTGWKGKV